MLIVKILLTLLYVAGYASNFHNFKCDLSVDTTNFSDGSYFSADYQMGKNESSSCKIFNPKFKYFMDGSFDVGYSVGARKGMGTSVIGLHPFLHYYYNPLVSFWHTGMTLEIFTRNWDIRNTFYYPFPHQKKCSSLLWKSHKWHELEITKNFDLFSLTGGFFWNYTIQKPAGRIKFTFPKDRFHVSVGVNIDPFKNLIPFVAVTFDFCEFKGTSIYKPVTYAQRVWCHGKPIKVTPKTVPKEEKIEHSRINEIEVLPEEEPEEILPAAPTAPNDKSWWESLFSTTE